MNDYFASMFFENSNRSDLTYISLFGDNITHLQVREVAVGL